MSQTFWPHQFVRTEDNTPKKIGEETLYDNTKIAILEEKFHCIHCEKIWIRNKEQQPQDACPERNDKRELKRILNKPKLPTEKKLRAKKPVKKVKKDA